MSTKDELPRGQLSNIILSILAETDKYGYEIIETVKEKTNNALVIKQPSLYSCLRRMENQNLISSYWRDSDIGGRRHYYSITDYGKKYAEKWNTDFNINQIKPKEDLKSDTEETLYNEHKEETILQQTTLIPSNETNNNTESLNKDNTEQKNDAYVQYNLFSSPTLISEPSNEVFDCIKKLRESADDEQQTLSLKEEDKLSFLRNETLENSESKIETSYVADNYNINNSAKTENISNNDVKKTFFEFSKKQKSFANTLKENPDIISYENEDLHIQNTTLPQTNTKNVSDNNDLDKHLTNILNQEDISLEEKETVKDETNNEKLENVEEDLSSTKEESNKTDDMPTIYQNTYKDTDAEAYYEDDSNNVEFIDLNNLDFNDKEKAEDAISSEIIFPTSNNEKQGGTSLEEENLLDEEPVNNFNVSNEETNNTEIPKPLNYDKEPVKEAEPKDDAIYITEKPQLENIPKVKKIAPARFEQYAKYDERLEKRMAEIRHNKELIEQQEYEQANSYVEENSDSYDNVEEKMVANDEQFSQINDFQSLQKYYKTLNIKFDVYKKSLNNQSRTSYINKHKLNMFSYLTISAISIIISLIMYFTCKNSQPNLNWMYITVPIFISLGNVYFVSKYLSNKSSITPITSYFNYNWIYMIVFTLVGILTLFSINLLCGMTFEMMHKFLTSFTYLSILSCLIPTFSLVNYIFIKAKIFKI